MSGKESKLAYVDSTRGIAILMVVLVHTAQGVPNLMPVVDGLAQYGQMGVQLFFVASAYTLCLSYERRLDEVSRLSSFYLRRLFRIAPLYYLGIAIYCGIHIGSQIYRTGQVASVEPYSMKNIVANMTFVHGIVPSANNTIVPGGWSIGTEMAFYLCFPLLFVVAKRVAEKHAARLGALLAFCMVANLALQSAVARITGRAMQNNEFMYLNIINQLPVFIVGIGTYLWARRVDAGSMGISRGQSALGFLVFSVAAAGLWKSGMPLAFALVPASSAVSFAFLLKFLKATKRQSAVLVRVGKVSYSMYVFHFVFAWTVAPAMVRMFSRVLGPEITLLLAYAIVVALTFLVAMITERTIEATGISVGAKLVSRVQARSVALKRIGAAVAVATTADDE